MNVRCVLCVWLIASSLLLLVSSGCRAICVAFSKLVWSAAALKHVGR